MLLLRIKQSRSQLSKDGGNHAGATPKYKDDAYWIHKERKEFGGSDQKWFDHHAFYAGYNATNVIYSARKAAYRVWGLATRENLYHYIPLKCQRMLLANNIRELQSIIIDYTL